MKILDGQKSKNLFNRYILYARKSTTSEDRQVASIESQIEVMKEVAKEHNLTIVDVLSESGSGFKTGRPVFNKMVEKIENGEADGVVVWKLSRLSRNPDDAGKIMGMLQRGQIRHIRTVERNWMPEDNVMMMYVEFAMNNQFSRDLSTDTKRGLLKKAERGWYPGASLPLGYQHIRYKALGDDEIIPDEHFPLVQKALKLVASGEMLPAQARVHMESLGLHGKRGTTLPPSTWYEMLVDPLYSGSFEFPSGSGTFYESKAVKAIEPEELEAIQVVLGIKTRPRPKTHFLPYTGLMKCGECGCSITGESKHKKQMNGNTHDYTYYRCTKKKGKCNQPCTNVVLLEKQYAELLSRIQIPEAFHQWAIEQIMKDQEKVIADRGESLRLSRDRYDACLKQIDNLIEKYLEGKVPEDYYKRKLAELEEQKKTLMGVVKGIDQRMDERIEEIDRDLGFAVTASQRFSEGDDHVRKEIISRLGSNLVLTYRHLDIELKKPLKMAEELSEEVQTVSKMFEPLEKLDNMVLFKDYLSLNPIMGG